MADPKGPRVLIIGRGKDALSEAIRHRVSELAMADLPAVHAAIGGLRALEERSLDAPLVDVLGMASAHSAATLRTPGGLAVALAGVSEPRRRRWEHSICQPPAASRERVVSQEAARILNELAGRKGR